ncbi:DUF4296 domain-containing protein [Niastella sp. OAS944]|uniref:DUF4296 domain-containing protein n=1 Tax=Niastella sp. OAS944 TaxID=2664089 RepID=UPI0034973364|nr:hypothetical protein [Chitinophagaceae bacterium OAS944]
MNRLLLVCLSAIALCVISCTDKDKIPSGVLPKDKMEKVLWDMIQAERYRDTFVRDSANDLKKETFKLYAQVFEIHQISKDEFVKSYKFYMSRPDIARAMFDTLATRANRRREEMNKPQPLDTATAHPKVDSLTKKDSTNKPAVDTTKTVKPVSTNTANPLSPLTPRTSTEELRKRFKRGPMRRLNDDSLHRIQLKKP